MPLIRIPSWVPLIAGRGIKLPDFDRLFCYDTPKLLRIIDFKPGLVYRTGLVFIILYCFGFALVTMQMYLETTSAVGVAMLSLSQPDQDKLIKSEVRAATDTGDAVTATGVVLREGAFDTVDLVYPPTEVGGIFLTTRVVSTTGQTMKECPDKTTKFPQCKSALPIYPGLKYPKTDYCMEYTWCPKFGQGGAASTDELLNSEELSELELKVNLFMHWFPLSDPETFIAKSLKIKVKDALAKAGIADLKAIQETGCVIYLKYSFGTAETSCNTADDDCEPDLEVVRLDDASTGFKYRRTQYYRGNGTIPKEMRDMSRMFGIRIVATVSGHGETFSLVAAMLQLASMFAMWQLVYFVADIFAVWPLNLYFLTYRELKYEETPDFGDLKEAAEAAKIDAAANKKGNRPRVNRARVKSSGEEEEDD